LLWCNAIADRYVIEPAASRIARDEGEKYTNGYFLDA
jgi:hypothetical protein